MKKETSFSVKLQTGWTKKQLMEHYALSPEQYERILISLKEIHKGEK